MGIFNPRELTEALCFLIIRSLYYPYITKIDGELLAPLKSKVKLAGPLFFLISGK